MNHPKSTSHLQRQQHARSSESLILEIITDKADRGSLNEILHRAGWQAAMCRSLTTAEPLLPLASVVMCDEELPDGNWRDVLNHLEGMPMNPALIVTSHRADEHLWAEVLNLGAYDLLLEPFRTEEVVRTVETADDSLSRDRNRKSPS